MDFRTDDLRGLLSPDFTGSQHGEHDPQQVVGGSNEGDLAEALRDQDDKEAEAAQVAAEAEAALDHARRLAPNEPATLKAAGYFELAVKEDLIGAIRSFDQALAIQPEDSDALELQTPIFFKLGQVDKMVEGLERAYELDSANGRVVYGLTLAYEMTHQYAKMVPFFERLLQLEPERTHYGVQARYFQFLAEGSLASFHALEDAVRNVRDTEQCDDRTVQNREMVVAMVNREFDRYAKAWEGKWDRHHRGHGNWACPAQINEEANHAHLLLEHDHADQAYAIIDRAKNSTTRPFTDQSLCIFDKAAFKPKLDFMSGEADLARREFDNAVVQVMQNDAFPRGPIERSVLLETADLVAPDRVYSLYRQIIDDPVSLVSMERICANPWTFPNLLADPRFVEEVRTDGRFVEFLEHFGLIPGPAES